MEWLSWPLLIFMKAIAWSYASAPLRVQNLLSRGLGHLFRRVGLRREVIEANLMRAYPGDALTRRRTELSRQTYDHLGRLFFEIMLVVGPLRTFCSKRVRVVGAEHATQAAKEGRGVIFLASHVGNWELMAAGSVPEVGPTVLVTKHLKPEWLHRAFEKGRHRCGVLGTYEPKTLRDVLRTLRDRGRVGVVLDQYSGPPVGVRVPLFGVWVGTSTVVAAVARRTGAAVLPVLNYRRPDGTTIVEIRPALAWLRDSTPEREIERNTARYASVIEEDILRHPDQWLWSHRRFKGDLHPPEGVRSTIPDASPRL